MSLKAKRDTGTLSFHEYCFPAHCSDKVHQDWTKDIRARASCYVRVTPLRARDMMTSAKKKMKPIVRPKPYQPDLMLFCPTMLNAKPGID